jgi:rhodanese-related sulfurtransferase
VIPYWHFLSSDRDILDPIPVFLMLRTAVLRSTRIVGPRNNYGLNLLHPSFTHARFETTSTPSKRPLTPAEEKLKAAREKTNDLQRDWDAKELLYNELKPKTENPTPVSVLCPPIAALSFTRYLKDTFLIDVREPDEVIQGMIPSAVNLPLSVLANSLHLHHVAFKEKHGFEKPTKDQELIFYCRSGKRSTSASDIAKRNGYNKSVHAP